VAAMGGHVSDSTATATSGPDVVSNATDMQLVAQFVAAVSVLRSASHDTARHQAAALVKATGRSVASFVHQHGTEGEVQHYFSGLGPSGPDDLLAMALNVCAQLRKIVQTRKRASLAPSPSALAASLVTDASRTEPSVSVAQSQMLEIERLKMENRRLREKQTVSARRLRVSVSEIDHSAHTPAVGAEKRRRRQRSRRKHELTDSSPAGVGSAKAIQTQLSRVHVAKHIGPRTAWAVPADSSVDFFLDHNVVENGFTTASGERAAVEEVPAPPSRLDLSSLQAAFAATLKAHGTGHESTLHLCKELVHACTASATVQLQVSTPRRWWLCPVCARSCMLMLAGQQLWGGVGSVATS
jgi:hypothetical protein